MSRINTNVSSMVAQRVLNQKNNSMSSSLERLSTGLRINRGKDDPAGLIASEKLRSEKAAISSAIGNAERADQVLNIAEGGLQEVNSLLIELQGLVVETANDAGLSGEEKEANQQQVDSILQTIDRIASSTSFQGTKLLNGNFDFNTSSVNANIDDFEIQAANLPADGSAVGVDVTVTQSAQHAGVFLSMGGGAFDLTDSDSQFVIEVGGANGAREFTFSSGTTLADAASAINAYKEVTGVSAVASGDYIELKSTDYGSDEFVSVKVSDAGGETGGVVAMSAANEAARGSAVAAFTDLSNGTRDEGQDVGAIVNGQLARGKGRTVSVNGADLALNLTLNATGAQTLQKFDAFDITGGGAKFQIGQDVNYDGQVRLGIRNVQSRTLGSSDSLIGGYLDELGGGKDANMVDGDLNKAQNIVDKAIDQVSTLRGRLGSFQSNTIQSSINNLSVALENTSAAESVIRDTDFAAESANMTRNQILVQASTNTLALANNNPQNVLSLLG